jgi:tetratricopeptide (TPR) repeat protein
MRSIMFRFGYRFAVVLVLLLFQACASVPPETVMPQPVPGVAAPTPVRSPTDDAAAVRVPPQASLQSGVAAIDKLIEKGDQQRRQGQLQAAADTLERAMRLAPQVPAVYVALAQVQLDLQEFRRAEQLAQRALSQLAGVEHDAARRQKAEAWMLIAKARKAQGDHSGAEAASRQATGIW